MRLILLVSVCDNTPSVPSACFHMRLNVSQSITARSPSLSLSAVCLSLILPPLYLFLFIVVSVCFCQSICLSFSSFFSSFSSYSSSFQRAVYISCRKYFVSLYCLCSLVPL